MALYSCHAETAGTSDSLLYCQISTGDQSEVGFIFIFVLISFCFFNSQKMIWFKLKNK